MYPKCKRTIPTLQKFAELITINLGGDMLFLIAMCQLWKSQIVCGQLHFRHINLLKLLVTVHCGNTPKARSALPAGISVSDMSIQWKPRSNNNFNGKTLSFSNVFFFFSKNNFSWSDRLSFKEIFKLIQDDNM